MPEYIDPAWEYREDDPEIAEMVYGRCHKGDAVSDLIDERQYKSNSMGLRFGRGDPDRCFFRLGREKRGHGRENTLKPKECAWCKKVFPPRTAKAECCSWKCGVEWRAAGRRIPAKTCQTCKQIYNPRSEKSKYCSMDCWGVAWSARKLAEKPPAEKPVNPSCETCGTVLVGAVRLGRRRVCDACQRAAKNAAAASARAAARSEKGASPEIRACKGCGGNIVQPIGVREKLYCSLKCKKRCEKVKAKQGLIL